VSAAPRAGTGSFVSPRHEPRARAADYAALSAGWAALLAAAVAAARDRGDEPVAAVEVVPLGLATFALSKLVAKEKVDRWMREPFLEEHADGRREPRGEGLRYAIGELLACTRCVGMWSAAGLVALRVSRPREARVVNAVLGASALNDWAQAGFTALCARADASHERTGRTSAAPTERRFAR
jgi:hypothetical protein